MTAIRSNPALAWLAGGAGIVVAFLLLGVIAHAISPSPSGPALSSYATTAQGVAGWAELLERDGHRVHQLRTPFAQSQLPADATLVLLTGGAELAPSAAGPLQRFLNGGGRVILGGQAAALAPALHGAVVPLTSEAFLEDDALARGDNALRSITIAGAASRPIYFDEVVHGYGPATGFAALPERWWFAIIAFALALIAWALTQAARLGGSDPVAPPTPSPRAAYIEAMAQTLVRAASSEELRREVQLAADRESRFRGSLKT